MNEINCKFEAIIKNAITGELPSLEDRGKVIEGINDLYFKDTGTVLPSSMLMPLTEWFLLEVLKDKNIYKVSKQDYPILSNKQLKRRAARECIVTSEVSDYLNLRYVEGKSSLCKTATREVDN